LIGRRAAAKSVAGPSRHILTNQIQERPFQSPWSSLQGPTDILLGGDLLVDVTADFCLIPET
jgi:hypothetical protein